MQKKAGIHFNINSNADILAIDSPRNRVSGPWCVLARGGKRWIMVALDWDHQPSVGIRWFHGNSGTPISSSYATWFIIPEELQKSILETIKLSSDNFSMVQDYLSGRISGQQLRDRYQTKTQK